MPEKRAARIVIAMITRPMLRLARKYSLRLSFSRKKAVPMATDARR